MGKVHYLIGGMQGNSQLPPEATQKATKSCHGIFPKRLVMEAICRLAEQLNIEKVMAVSTEQHIFRSPRYPRSKQSDSFQDYNAFWASLGGGVRQTAGTIIFRVSGWLEKAKRRLPVKNAQNTAVAISYWDSIHAQLSSMFRH